MNDDGTPKATAARHRWIGLVWAVPLSALIIVVFLGVRALAHRGIEIVLTVSTAVGAKVGDTKVIYQGIEGGEVTKVEINEDGKRVDLTLRVDPRVEPYLNTNTIFWLVGAKPELSDLASVKAALAGLEIGVAPALGGTPTTHFVAADQPPQVLPGTPGTHYQLSATQLRSARIGSSLFYRGQDVGKVTAVARSQGAFRIDVFVFAPFDSLMRPETLFWSASLLNVGFNDRGISASIEHPGAVLTGGIEIDTPDDAAGPPALAGTVFELYPTREEARDGPDGPGLPYRLAFDGAAGDLSVGSGVRLHGFRVGKVTSVKLVVDAEAGVARTRVDVVIYPARLQLGPPAVSATAARATTDAALRRLVARGYRARLVQRPPLIGGLTVSLEPVPHASPAALIAGDPSLIPSDEAAPGIEQATGQVNQILAKVNRVPIEAIGQHVRHAAAQLDALVSSPQLSQSLRHLDSSLDQADAILKEVRPQVGPLVVQLKQAADEIAEAASAAHGLLSGDGAPQDSSLPEVMRQLGDAAQAMRSLADYLARHPEALVRGK